MGIIGEIVKTSFILVLTLGSSTTIFAQDKINTELKGELINGQVKVLKEKSYKYLIEDQDTVLDYELVNKFNETGLLKERKGLGQLSTYEYNSKNQIERVDVCTGDRKRCTVNEYSYENGNLVKHFSKHPESNEKTTVYNEYFITHFTYNKHNQLIELSKFRKPTKSKNEIFVEHEKYDYDSLGNKVIEEELSESGKVFKRIKHKYSDSMLVESFTWIKFEGEDLYTKEVYEYYDDGKIKSKNEIVFDYNSTDRIAQQFLTTYKYEFDKEGRLIRKNENSFKPKITEFHDFDSKNNWLRKIINDEKNIKVILRDFEYFH